MSKLAWQEPELQGNRHCFRIRCEDVFPPLTLSVIRGYAFVGESQTDSMKDVLVILKVKVVKQYGVLRAWWIMREDILEWHEHRRASRLSANLERAIKEVLEVA